MSKMPHIQLDESINATAAILPGDPARVDVIAEYLTDVKEEGFNREYKSVTGTYKGRRILAISTGMGGPSTAICVEELADLGVKDMIRIGSCGALQSRLSLGELVLCDRAVCDDGTSQTYLDTFRYAAAQLDGAWKAGTDLGSGYEAAGQGISGGSASEPDGQIICAYADSLLLDGCREAAKREGFCYEVGATRSHDGLYLKRKAQLDEFYSTKGVLGSDMETAALFAVSKVRKVRAASILNVVVEWKKDLKEGISSYKDGADAAAQGEKREIIAALEALAGIK